MNPYWTLVKYGVVAALGGAGCWYAVAVPRLDALHLAQAKAAQIAADEHAAFVDAARTKEKESQDAIDMLSGQLAQRQVERDRTAAALRTSNSMLNDAIARAIQPHPQGLPGQASAPASTDPTTALLGVLVQESAGLAAECAGKADELSDQVRALQQAYAATL
jgi:hypothetical protein